MLKVVVDTNIWIRVLLRGKTALPVSQAWRDGRFEVLVSDCLLDELDRVWQRPRLRRHIDPEQAAIFLERLRQRGTLISLKTVPPHCRDPKDDPVLATAIDGQADAIVSGDESKGDATLFFGLWTN
ncbi:MAG: putative toxin-antitoxin system toxin component, PIN family [Gammaproteobacteria bacterium]|nr:putative toxin-antitoxin system toxin component, PIN family [Gammaproteobacteria bacterium]